MKSDVNAETAYISSSADLEKDTCRLVNPPVYRGTTVIFDSYIEMMGNTSKYIYGRWATPTSNRFCEEMSSYEHGYAAIATCSGLAAISTTMLALLSNNDHVLVNQTSYPAVLRFLNTLKKKINIDVEVFNKSQVDNIWELNRKNTRLVFYDVPGICGLDIPDLSKLKEQLNDVILIVDNTWSTPYFYNPILHGADIVLHSTSKYIGGHSDSIMGAIIFKEKQLYDHTLEFSRCIGQCAGSDDLTTALRGFRTLPIRMQRHFSNALKVANFLDEHPLVSQVNYIPLKSGGGHDVWVRDFRGAGGQFTFQLKDKYESRIQALLDSLKLVQLGWGWGGYETLASVIDLNNQKYIRLSVGLESTDDIISDLDNALWVFGNKEK